MKKLALLVLLFSTMAWAVPSPDEYSIKIHVISSRWEMTPSSIGPRGVQKISVIIDGKKYELLAPGKGATLLAVGDYQAKLVQDEHKSTYESTQSYEFLFPDKKTRKYIVVGQSE